MAPRRPGTVVEGALPADTGALPNVDGLSTTGFASMIDRAVGVVCLASLLPGVLGAERMFDHLNPWWLAIFAGGITALSVLLPWYAWSRRGIRPLAAGYAALVLLGLVTFPLAWMPNHDHGSQAPVLYLQLGLATICAGIAVNTRFAAGYAAASALAFFLVRSTEQGGAASQLQALQDTLIVIVQPAVILLILHYLRDQVIRFDAQLSAAHAETTDAAVNEALVAERHRLDAIVHDEIMTTLVAGAHSRTPHDPRVVEQARLALRWLHAEPVEADDGAVVSADRLVRLIKDVTGSVCPRAQVLGEIPAATVTLPQGVVRTLMQATREAALNAEKHSRAEHVQVLVNVQATARRVTARVSVADDGVGFDPNAVAPQRLGLRVAIGERLHALGGRAEVQSAPGRGATVRLFWAGDRPRQVHTRHRTLANPGLHPVLRFTDPTPVVAASVGMIGIYMLIGATTMPQLRRPDLVGATMVLMAGTLALAFYGMLRPPIGRVRGWTQMGLAVLISSLSLGVLEINERAGLPLPGQGHWFVTLVMMVFVATFAAGQPLPAWTGACTHAVLVGLLAVDDGLTAAEYVLAVLTPLLWLIVAAVVFYFLDVLWTQLDEAEREVRDSARTNAALFGKLVLREVWLAELRAEVGPLLEQLADPARPLTEADRSTYLLTESSLRDGIMAANFHGPGLAAAIMDARLRGVRVTLVDNRGSRLPESARLAALRTLERVVRSSTGGRIVARTAPEGYAEAVTILQVEPEGATELTRIGDDGMVESGRP